MKFKQATYQDISNIIEEAIDNSINHHVDDLCESIKLTFAEIDRKLMEFFDE